MEGDARSKDWDPDGDANVVGDSDGDANPVGVPDENPNPVGDPGRAPTSDELAEAICQLHAAEMAVHLRLLDLVRRYDTGGLWKEDGASSMVEWLMSRLSIGRQSASEWVRVASVLPELPAIRATAESGRLSWDQLAPLTKAASRETDEALATEAPGWSAAQVREVAARRAAPTVRDAAEAHRARRLAWWPKGPMLHLRGELPADAGAVVAAALARLSAGSPKDPETDTFLPFEQRAADALVALASTHLADDADADRATVVVHTDVAALLGGDEGFCELEDGPRLAAVTARRLACDCRWQLVAEDGAGDVVRLGRTTRQVPAWLLRRLRQRDHGCRFPGCGRQRFLHAHHVVHWADGGATDPDNLVSLCSFHHRFLHEGHWRIETDADGTTTFVRPDGRPMTSGPTPLRRDVHRRLFGPDPPQGEG
jgi:Domain of unknown function (DUF222)/HNH endonuclease